MEHCGSLSNKALGTSYEERLAEELFNRGFWVHLIRQTEEGQPADLIACRNGKAFLIDAKVCSDGTFPLYRIEENQELAMKAFMEAGNETGWFALLVDDETYMLPLSFFLMHRAWSGRSLSKKTIKDRAFTLDEWEMQWFTA